MNPLTAKIEIEKAKSGLWAATIENGITAEPSRLVGFLTRADAEEKAERFCCDRLGRRAIFRQPIEPKNIERKNRREIESAEMIERVARIRDRRNASARRLERKAARAAKESMLRWA